MKPIKLTLAGLCLSAATSLFAANHTTQNHENMNHANMNHGTNSNSHHAAYHNEMMTKDDYKVVLHTNKPFVNGNNEVEIMISHMEKTVNNAEVKIKFFMPEMPGMPYMEYESKAKFEDGKYKCDVNLAMNGTWQYQLRFRTDDKKIRMVKGSVNY
ncbi:MAG: FixH family protein [Arcobacteraceae bacterium]